MAVLKNVTYSDIRDLDLIEKGINYNVWLMCGNNIEYQKLLRDILIKKCVKLNIIGKTDKHDILSKQTLGYCSADEHQNYTIEMYGYKNSTSTKQKLIHESVHEFCHAMQHIMCDNSKSYDFNGYRYYAHGGVIIEEDINKKSFSKYGVMFCETVTDLLTSIALVYQDHSYSKSDLDADKILTQNYFKIANNDLVIDGYTIYT